jgi:hypothetical protein
VRPFTPSTPAIAYMLWSEAWPLSNLAKTFRAEVRNASRLLDDGASTESAPVALEDIT